MGTNSKIEWTDHTASPWHGCAHKVDDGVDHPACAHCYAETMAKRNPSTLGVWGEQGTRVLSKSFDAKCRAWNAAAAKRDVQERVFPSICDPFEAYSGNFPDNPPGVHGGVRCLLDNKGNRLCTRVGTEVEIQWPKEPGWRPFTMHDARQNLFDTIDNCPHLDFLLLTKRPENVRDMWPVYPYHACETGDCLHWDRDDCDLNRQYRDNVWLGTSISDQRTADIYVHELLTLRDLTPVLFLSIEPLLGPVDLTRLDNGGGEKYDALRAEVRTYGGNKFRASDTDPISWVIVGGESGPRARPMHPDWVRSIRDQCQAAGVPFHFKQWGEWMDLENSSIDSPKELHRHTWTWLDRNGESGFTFGTEDRACMVRVGKAAAGRTLDGRTWDEFPEDDHAP